MRNLIAPFALLLVGLGAAPAPAGPPQELSLETARSLLKSRQWKDRLDGLEYLEKFEPGGDAEKLVVGAIDDSDWGVVIRASQALETLGTPKGCRDRLVRLSVQGTVQWIRDAAAKALAKVDPDGASSALLGYAKRVRTPPEKERALRAAAATASAEDVKALEGFLTHKDALVGAAAARALGEIGRRDPAVAPAVAKSVGRLLKLRGDRKHFPRYAAVIEALGRMDEGSSRKLLVGEVLRWPTLDGYVIERIARGLATQEREGVVAALEEGFAQGRKPEELRRLLVVAARLRAKEAAETMIGLASHKDARVRSHALCALGRSGAESAVDAAKAALGDRDPYVRVEAVTALARLQRPVFFRDHAEALAKDRTTEVRLQFIVEMADHGDPGAIETLTGFFDDAAWRVASAAVCTVGTLGVAQDLPLVEPLFRHRDWKVRGAAYEAAGRLRAADAVPHLAAGLEDPDPVVRGVCHANLQILTEQKLPPDPGAWQRWWTKNGDALDIEKQSRKDPESRKVSSDEDRYGFGKRGIEILQKARILVVQGAWDKAQLVLDHLDIGHTLLRAQQLKAAGLNPNQVVLVNCEGNVDEDSAERLQWFVNTGGYLMSTDWALTKAVQRCFPGYASQFSGSNTGNDVVVVEEGLPGHPFTRGVFDGVPAMKWWLEIQAFPIKIDYPERTDVIVDSSEMMTKYGASPMAVAFRWGLGKVQHSLSHFFLQEEGMTAARKPDDRKIFAADHLGLSIEQIRELDEQGRWDGQLNEETMKKIAPDYSMFRLIVNVVAEKEAWVENL